MTGYLHKFRFSLVCAVVVMPLAIPDVAGGVTLGHGPKPTLTIPGNETSVQWAKENEPKITFPKQGFPDCVGTDKAFGGRHCERTIGAALKNKKSKIYVSPGYGTAENLSVTKGTTICAGELKDKVMQCIDKPSDNEKFRLVRKDPSKPCITIGGKANGSVNLTGMLLQDESGATVPCIKGGARGGALNINHSRLKNVSFDLKNLKAFKLDRSTLVGPHLTVDGVSEKVELIRVGITADPLSSGNGSLLFKRIENVIFSGPSVFEKIDVKIENVADSKLNLGTFTQGRLAFLGTGKAVLASDATIAVLKFEEKVAKGTATYDQASYDKMLQDFAEGVKTGDMTEDLPTLEEAGVFVNGAVSVSIRDGRFEKSPIELNGSAIQQIQGNLFSNSELTLQHEGMSTISYNSFLNTSGDENPFISAAANGGEASVLVRSGVNQIQDNVFLGQCLPDSNSINGYLCDCTEKPVLEMDSASIPWVTTFKGNDVCTDNPEWLGDADKPIEVYDGNCVVTLNSKVPRNSRTFYKNATSPPAKARSAIYLSGKRKPKGLPASCDGFIEFLDVGRKDKPKSK